MSEPSPDAFKVVTDLIALAGNPAAASKRLGELQAQIDKAEAATAKLAADREQHATAVAAARAELEARGAAVLRRETAVGITERDLVRREQALKAAMPPRFTDDPNLNPGGRTYSGLSREAAHG
jgi:hypothetical protein